MLYRSRALYVYILLLPFIAISFDAHAEWVLSVTGGADTLQVSEQILQTTMGGAAAGSAGNMHSYLGVWPHHTDPVNGPRYYAAFVVGSLYVKGNRKSTGVSHSIGGDLEVKWTWVDEDFDSANNYIWDYSVKGEIAADARVELEDNGGYGKSEAYAEIRLVAAGVDIPAQDENIGASAGAEVRADGEAWTGFGLGIDGFDVSWDAGGQQLDATETLTRTVTLSDTKRPGSRCWVKVHTLVSATLHSFHDTFKWENSCSARAYMLGDGEYSLYTLQSPEYSPE